MIMVYLTYRKFCTGVCIWTFCLSTHRNIFALVKTTNEQDFAKKNLSSGHILRVKSA